MNMFNSFISLSKSKTQETRIAPSLGTSTKFVRYLFSPRIAGSINLLEAKLDLTKRCIWYLCQNHHVTFAMENHDDFDNKILSGLYRFHYYASTMWPELVEDYLQCAATETLPQDLISALETLHDQRGQRKVEELDQKEAIEGGHVQAFQQIRTTFPNL